MSHPFVEPSSHIPLVRKEDGWYQPDTGICVAPIRDGIARFVQESDHYAESFGYQWNRWTDNLSDARTATDTKLQLLRERTHFADYDLDGKSVLECGMGGGDDTEILLQMPFAEVHAFDLSRAVDRCKRYLEDPRLTLSQASIFEIPYADRSFDVVYCHRVLQHTPNPIAALRAICKKVNPGGILFAHVYKRSWRYMLNYKYKYRWMTKRLPLSMISQAIELFGPLLHQLHQTCWRNRLTKFLAYNFVPFEPMVNFPGMTDEQVLEIAKLCTFDALTPAFDLPLTRDQFCQTIESEGFRIDHLHDPEFSPLYCTATQVGA